MEVKLQERYKLFINGEWRDASDGQTVKTYSPVDGSLLAEVAECNKRRCRCSCIISKRSI